MKYSWLLIALVIACTVARAQSKRPGWGELPPFTAWHQNPLGVSPLSLHTGNSLWLPALATTAILLLTPSDSLHHQKRIYLHDTGVASGYYGSKTTVVQQHTGVLFEVRQWLAIGGEVTLYHVRDAVNNTWGYGLRPFARFYLLQGVKIKLFFESGAGLIFFVDTFPKPSGFPGDQREGTHLNGSPKYGIGSAWKIHDVFSLQFGWRHVHISNGDHPGADRNPGHDSNGLHIGFLYHPPQ